MGFQAPVGTESPPFSPATSPAAACSTFGGEDFFCFIGEGDADLATDELSDCPSLDSDLDLDLDL